MLEVEELTFFIGAQVWIAGFLVMAFGIFGTGLLLSIIGAPIWAFGLYLCLCKRQKVGPLYRRRN